MRFCVAKRITGDRENDALPYGPTHPTLDCRGGIGVYFGLACDGMILGLAVHWHQFTQA